MANGSTFSVIGADVVITGDIAAEVDLHINGTVNGDVKCASLVQSDSSTVTGAIIAQTARLAGTVNGAIEAHELIIEASARITGDVTYETITIEQGGHVDGLFKHKSKIAAARNAAANDTRIQSSTAPTGERPALPLTKEQQLV